MTLRYFEAMNPLLSLLWLLNELNLPKLSHIPDIALLRAPR